MNKKIAISNLKKVTPSSKFNSIKIIEATKVIKSKRSNLIIRFREMNFAIKAGRDAAGSKFS